MYEIGEIQGKNRDKSHRLLDATPVDRGRRHYWRYNPEEYVPQVEQKVKTRGYTYDQSKRNNRSNLNELRYTTEPIQQNYTPKYRKDNHSSLERNHYDGYIRRGSNNGYQRNYRQNNEEQQDYFRYNIKPKNVDNFDEVNRIVLPSIKKIQQEVQTTNSLMKFEPPIVSQKEQKQRTPAINHQAPKNKPYELVPNSFGDKKKLSAIPRVSKIGHEADERYEKYEKSPKNQIKIKSYKSYLKYTPTYASSQNNLLSHYFGDGPLEYEDDLGREQAIRRL